MARRSDAMAKNFLLVCKLEKNLAKMPNFRLPAPIGQNFLSCYPQRLEESKIRMSIV